MGIQVLTRKDGRSRVLYDIRRYDRGFLADSMALRTAGPVQVVSDPEQATLASGGVVYGDEQFQYHLVHTSRNTAWASQDLTFEPDEAYLTLLWERRLAERAADLLKWYGLPAYRQIRDTLVAVVSGLVRFYSLEYYTNIAQLLVAQAIGARYSGPVTDAVKRYWEPALERSMDRAYWDPRLQPAAVVIRDAELFVPHFATPAPLIGEHRRPTDMLDVIIATQLHAVFQETTNYLAKLTPLTTIELEIARLLGLGKVPTAALQQCDPTKPTAVTPTTPPETLVRVGYDLYVDFDSTLIPVDNEHFAGVGVEFSTPPVATRTYQLPLSLPFVLPYKRFPARLPTRVGEPAAALPWVFVRGTQPSKSSDLAPFLTVATAAPLSSTPTSTTAVSSTGMHTTTPIIEYQERTTNRIQALLDSMQPDLPANLHYDAGLVNSVATAELIQTGFAVLWAHTEQRPQIATFEDRLFTADQLVNTDFFPSSFQPMDIRYR